MKKIFSIIALATTAMFCGCNSCTQITKNIESDFGDLDRDVLVINSFTNDTLFRYSGPCYISEDSNYNSVTLIYYVGKKAKKADWVGSGFIFQAIEK